VRAGRPRRAPALAGAHRSDPYTGCHAAWSGKAADRRLGTGEVAQSVLCPSDLGRPVVADTTAAGISYAPYTAFGRGPLAPLLVARGPSYEHSRGMVGGWAGPPAGLCATC
jgi:hypothetical protein